MTKTIVLTGLVLAASFVAIVPDAGAATSNCFPHELVGLLCATANAGASPTTGCGGSNCYFANANGQGFVLVGGGDTRVTGHVLGLSYDKSCTMAVANDGCSVSNTFNSANWVNTFSPCVTSFARTTSALVATLTVSASENDFCP